MSDFASEFVRRLGEASVFMTIAGLVVAIALRLLKCRVPALHFAAWCFVLLQGFVLIQVPLQLRLSSAVSAAPGKQPARTAAVQADSRASLTTSVTPSPSQEAQPDVATDAELNWLRQDTSRQGTGFPSFSVFAIAIWVIGMFVIVLRRARAYRRFLMLANCWECHDPQWNLELNQLLNEFGIENRLALYLSRNVGPALCRWPREYRIVVPIDLWRQLTPREREAVLRHEIAHFQRGDIFRSLLAQCLALPHWFNPTTWWAVREMEKSIEFSCDDLVRRSGTAIATSYAKALLRLGRGDLPLPVWSAAFGDNAIAIRVRRVLAPAGEETSRLRNAVIASILAVLLLTHLFRVELVARELPQQAEERETSPVDKQWIVSDDDFARAAGALRDRGGFVRTFHDRSSPQRWVQIILESRAPGQLPTFVPVDQSKAPSFGDQDLEHVRLLTLDSKAHVHLRGGSFSRDGLKMLAGTRITRLEISDSMIRDAEVLELPQLESLIDLSLNDVRLSEVGIDALARCVRLESIGLPCDDETGPSILAVLPRLPQLQSVALIGDFSAAAASELNACAQLKSLRLQIGTRDAVDAFLQLNCLDSVTKLAINGEAISADLIMMLADQATQLKELYARGHQGVTPAAMRALARLPNLEVLALDGTNVNDAAVALLKPLQNLRWLDLSSSAVTDRSLIVAGNLPKLRYLGLMGTNVTSAGLEYLSSLTELNHVNVYGTYVKSLPDWMSQRPKLQVSWDGEQQEQLAGREEEEKSSLEREVESFNARAGKHRVGKFEPSLTVEEVVAAIRSWDRVQQPVDDQTLVIFQEIADTKELPEGARLSSTSAWQTPEFRYQVWWIDLTVMTGERTGYTYRLRRRLISSEKLPQ